MAKKKKKPQPKLPKGGGKPPPSVLAMIVCSEDIIDIRTKNRTLVNLFTDLYGPRFPLIHPKMTIYIEMTNGHGVCPIAIQLVEASTDKTLARIDAKLRFPDPLAVAQMALALNNIVFEKPGEYRFQLYGRDDLLMERRIIVRQVKGKRDDKSK